MNTSTFSGAKVFALIFLNIFCACSNQLSQPKTITKASAYPSALERAMKNKRYFIMQSGINLYTVTSVDLDRAKQQMTVTLDKVDSLHLRSFKNPALRGNKLSEAQKTVQPEIYVFMKDSTSYTLDEPHTILVKNVDRIELIN